MNWSIDVKIKKGVEDLKGHLHAIRSNSSLPVLDNPFHDTKNNF
jgi:hypothetical protein